MGTGDGTIAPMLVLLLTMLHAAFAQPAVPDALQPWVPWVLAEHPELRCPILDGAASCIWPGVLDLTVHADGGQMDLSVQVDRDIVVPLPGGAGAWPQQVRVDGDVVVVTDEGGIPAVSLTAGTHRITGTYVWSRPPQDIAVPASIGLISVAILYSVVVTLLAVIPATSCLQIAGGAGCVVAAPTTNATAAL